MANNVVVALLVTVIGLTMITASIFGSYSIVLGKTDSGSGSGSSSGSSDSGSGSSNEKGSADSGSNSGSNDNNAGGSSDSGPALKEATPTKPANDVNTIPPTEEAKKKLADEKPTCLIPEGCGPGIPNGAPTPTPTPTPPPPKTTTGPDHECLFKPELPKCKSDNGKCPDGFAQNGDGNCFPKHDRCPKGFHSHEDDETGRCVSDKVPCEPGFIRDPSFPTCNSKTSVCRDHPQTKGCNSDNEDAGRCLSGRELRQDFCIRVILTIHHSGSSSNSNNNNPNHSVSDKCFSQIKIAWLAKIQRGQNSQIDSIINKCLEITIH